MPLCVVVTLEGLATAPLGCYGCSWNQTPALDRVASAGVVWDRWTSHCDHPSALIKEWLRGSNDVVNKLRAHGSAKFVTDDTSLPIADVAGGFDDLTQLRFDRLDAPAEQLESTSLGRFMAASIDQATRDTSLLWLHSDCLTKVWDAPEAETLPAPEVSERRSAPDEEFEEAEAYSLPASTTVPQIQLASDDDPDLVFAWMRRYALQVSLLDSMIDLLQLSTRDFDPRIVIAGSSGFSLGQNGWIGQGVGPLRSPEIRLPLFTSFGGPIRVPTIESAEQFPSIFAKVASGDPCVTADGWGRHDTEFDPLIITASNRARRAATTSRWFFVADDGDQSKLFVKPDDTDDANDVSRLRRETEQEFAERLETLSPGDA